LRRFSVWQLGLREGLHMSLRKIAAQLTLRGFVDRNGQPYPATSIKNMLGKKAPKLRGWM
jgi:hypothetical protein